jgi:cell division protease FtsH
LGQEFGEQRNYSEEMAKKIDKEVTQFIQSAQKTAENILKKKRKVLEKIAQTLIDKETIEREEFEELIGGHPTATQKKSKIITPFPKREKSIKERSIRVKIKHL